MLQFSGGVSFSPGNLVFALKPSLDYVRVTYISQVSVLYLKATAG